MQEHNSKVALITGGSRGIGAAIVKQLSAQGAKVAFTYSKSKINAEKLVKEISDLGGHAIAIPADSVDVKNIILAVEQTVFLLGQLDILVNNAGLFATGKLHQLSMDDFDQTVSINIRAVFAASWQAARHLPDGGRIISIGSCLAPRAGRAGISLYSMSKSALVGLTKGLAHDLGPRRITVNLIQPGPTDTDMNPANSPKAVKTLQSLALPAYGRPEDIAAMVLHLAGPGGNNITGSVIDIDGGFNA
ncbi:SDR family oxidoreductase [Rahnella sp. CG8]|uniref:SDR family NAD(P)-dependent oxidoreductase n=1 Tax=Rahnella sp. CG8 TaxID=2726078 RepID=UPI002033F3B5|nr:SDR family oxidoreductase [Rahnella sp. CG8]MCM2448474.1 SDR family oxidoreductase [Rahnella sp. CG8]